MRREFYLALVAMMCFTGCGNQTSNSTIGTQDVESTQETTQEEIEMVAFDGPVTPEAWSNSSLSEYEIVANCGNFDMKIYPFSMIKYVDFFIFSKEPLLEDVELVIDTDAPYSYDINERDFSQYTGAYLEQNLTYDLYSAYQERDWQQLYDMKGKTEEALAQYESALQEAEGISEIDVIKAANDGEGLPNEQLEQLVELRNRWKNLNEKESYLSNYYWSHYQQFLQEINMEDLEFHCYGVSISFASDTKDAMTGMRTINCFKLQSGEWSTEIGIGNIEIYYDKPDFTTSKGIERDFKTVKIYTETPIYDAEEEYYNDIIGGTATENITITDMFIYENENFKIEKARIEIQTDAGIQTVLWEAGREILIRAGEEFTIDMIISNKKSEVAYHGYQLYPMIQYKVGDEVNYLEGEFLNGGTGQKAVLEAKAVYLDGIDLQSYYKDYYYKKIVDLSADWDAGIKKD